MQFPGHYHNRESGFYYNWNRYYYPVYGRYNRFDPIGDSQEHYGYAGNNPISNFDPSGLTYQSNWDFFWDFAFGRGNSSRYYGPNTMETQEMRASPGVKRMRDKFYALGCINQYNLSYGTARAYYETVVQGDLGSTATQVGGFGRARPIVRGDRVVFTIKNKAGTRSLFFHVVPDRKGYWGPMRSIWQTFQWSEKIDKCKCGMAANPPEPLPFPFNEADKIYEHYLH